MQVRRTSKKRSAIYEALCNTTAHPSAEQLYSQLKPEIPDLSLGTVYRNLRQMAAGGRLVELSGPVARFDAVIAPHTHFRCTGCGAVLDLDLPYDPALDARAAEQGCTVTGHSLCFTGLCPQCGASAGTNS